MTAIKQGCRIGEKQLAKLHCKLYPHPLQCVQILPVSACESPLGANREKRHGRKRGKRKQDQALLLPGSGGAGLRAAHTGRSRRTTKPNTNARGRWEGGVSSIVKSPHKARAEAGNNLGRAVGVPDWDRVRHIGRKG